MLNDIEKAYLAGAMDSDGWFMIRKIKPESGGGRANFSFYLGVGFCQVDSIIPDILAKEFGGAVRLRQARQKKGEKTNGWRPNYYWTVSSKEAYHIAKDLFPFLKVKQRQAEICMLLQENINKLKYSWMSKGRKGANPLPIEVVDYRTKLFEELRSLHDNRISQQSMI